MILVGAAVKKSGKNATIRKCKKGESYDQLRRRYRRDHDILLKSKEEIHGMRKAGHLAAQILEKLCSFTKEGVTTGQINELAMQLHKEAGAIPAPLGYGDPPFPKGICTSLNEVICHGIPDDHPLQDGDILNIDVTSILDGYYGDCSQMVKIGNVVGDRALVVEVAHECLKRATEVLRPGVQMKEIANAIEPYARSRGCSTVHQFVGHGVGVRFHEGPQIAHSLNQCQIKMVPGMTFTIEPMINAGARKAIIDKTDQWTARTIDNLPSAQWEYTFLITEEGYEILTPWKRISF